jgi:hypothetical protein
MDGVREAPFPYIMVYVHVDSAPEVACVREMACVREVFSPYN